MVISAEDGGGLTAPANARVNVSVVGGSVTAPVFEQAQYFFTVSEGVLRGTPVGSIRAVVKTGQESFKSLVLLLEFIFVLFVSLVICPRPFVTFVFIFFVSLSPLQVFLRMSHTPFLPETQVVTS